MREYENEWRDKITTEFLSEPEDDHQLYKKSGALFSYLYKAGADENADFMMLLNLISSEYADIEKMVTGGYAERGYYLDYYLPKYIEAAKAAKRFLNASE